MSHPFHALNPTVNTPLLFQICIYLPIQELHLLLCSLSRHIQEEYVKYVSGGIFFAERDWFVEWRRKYMPREDEEPTNVAHHRPVHYAFNSANAQEKGFTNEEINRSNVLEWFASNKFEVHSNSVSGTFVYYYCSEPLLRQGFPRVYHDASFYMRMRKKSAVCAKLSEVAVPLAKATSQEFIVALFGDAQDDDVHIGDVIIPAHGSFFCYQHFEDIMYGSEAFTKQDHVLRSLVVRHDWDFLFLCLQNVARWKKRPSTKRRLEVLDHIAHLLIDEKWRSNKAFMMRAVQIYDGALNLASQALKNDEDLVRIAEEFANSVEDPQSIDGEELE